MNPAQPGYYWTWKRDLRWRVAAEPKPCHQLLGPPAGPRCGEPSVVEWDKGTWSRNGFRSSWWPLCEAHMAKADRKIECDVVLGPVLRKETGGDAA